MPTTAHFTLAYWCVLIAALLPLVCATLAKKGGFGRAPQAGGYDNHAPREWLARQQARLRVPTLRRPTPSRRCRFSSAR